MTDKTQIAELQSMPQAEFDKLGFVCDNLNGGYYVAECGDCGVIFPSQQSEGGQAIADTGDYEDCLCPHCGHVDPEECDNANLVWNVQQLKITNLTTQLEAAEAEISALRGAAAIPVAYFAAAPDYGWDMFKTKEDAIALCEEEIAAYRESRDDGWDDDVQRVCWGIVLQKAEGFDEQAIHTSNSNHTYQTCDYSLHPVLPTHPAPPVVVLPIYKMKHWRMAPCNGVDWAKGYHAGWNKVVQMVLDAGFEIKSADGEGE